MRCLEKQINQPNPLHCALDQMKKQSGLIPVATPVVPRTKCKWLSPLYTNTIEVFTIYQIFLFELLHPHFVCGSSYKVSWLTVLLKPLELVALF